MKRCFLDFFLPALLNSIQPPPPANLSSLCHSPTRWNCLYVNGSCGFLNLDF